MALLVIDASLAHRIAKSLRERGRESHSCHEYGIHELKDPPLLREVFGKFPGAVLVTGDYAMPGDHRDVIQEVGATVAAVVSFKHCKHPWQSAKDGMEIEEAYKWEVVHRWAHRMSEQERGTCKRYGLKATGEWTPKVRTIKMAQMRMKIPR